MLQQLTIDYHQGTNLQQKVTHEKLQFHFYVITYGHCSFHRQNGDVLVAEKGDFVLAPQQCDYTERSAENSLHQKYSLGFTATPNLLHMLPQLQKDQWLHSRSGIYERSIDMLRPLWKEASEGLHYVELRIASFLLDTLALWQRELERGELAPASFIHIERMKHYIQTHYRQKVTKDVLADYIRRSPSYAASLFKKGTGQTISEYVHAIRMKTAMYMLSASLLSITEISEYLGYADVSYFQRLFKRTFGQPPSDFMQERRDELQF
jgi:AraC-like DNA-binding protein